MTTATQTDFEKIKKHCLAEPKTLLQINGALPIHVVSTPGEEFTSVVIVNETHQASIYFNYSILSDRLSSKSCLE